MISRTLKLKPNSAQAALLVEWFHIATGVWNWGLRRLIDTEREVWMYRERYESLCLQTRGHAVRIGFNAQALQGILKDLCRSWDMYRDRQRGRPNWKGARNRVSSIPLRNDKRRDSLRREHVGVRLPTIGVIRCRGHRRLPAGRFVCARIQRTPRGWYLTVIIDASPNVIPIVGNEPVGIDLGYKTMAALSTGEKIEHPDELRRLGARIGQADRSHNRRLVGRLQQRLALGRRKRNHAISRDLVSRFGAIYVSRDNIRGLQRRFGKSVLSAGHGALLTMLQAKCRQAGREYVEVPSRNSTRRCSSCQALTGPTGLRGLSVRVWTCACGATHDRDINAAVNTLRRGAVLALEMASDRQSEISRRLISPISAGVNRD